MPAVALIDRGHVEQVWHGHRLCDVDASRLRGTLIEVEGDVAAGMAYRDGRFWIAPPRPTADEIRAEADRRLGVFPPAFQEQLASRGGEFAAEMFRYTHAVHVQCGAFLAMDCAPADFIDDACWPAIPDLSLSPVPVVVPVPVQHAVAPSAPVEVRVVLEGTGKGMTDTAPVRVIEHQSGITEDFRNSAPVQPGARTEPMRLINLDLSPAHAALLVELANAADAKARALPGEIQDEFASRIAAAAVARVRASDLAGLESARADMLHLIKAV